MYSSRTVRRGTEKLLQLTVCAIPKVNVNQVIWTKIYPIYCWFIIIDLAQIYTSWKGYYFSLAQLLNSALVNRKKSLFFFFFIGVQLDYSIWLVNLIHLIAKKFQSIIFGKLFVYHRLHYNFDQFFYFTRPFFAFLLSRFRVWKPQ